MVGIPVAFSVNKMKDQIISKITKDSPHMSWINQGLIYLTRHGSHAYNCHIEGSDEDFKGICIPPAKYMLGFVHRFEQAELNEPDCCIYNIQKFFNLAANCNPTNIELLWTDPEDHVFVSKVGQKLIDNRELFLSKKIRFTMAGYAFAQIKKIKLHRAYLLNPINSYPSRKELGLPEHTLIPKDQLDAVKAAVDREINKFNLDFLEGHTEDQKIGLRAIMSEMLASMKISTDDLYFGAARSIGINENLIHVMQKERDYESRKRQYDQYQNWKLTRNPKRAADEEKFGFDCKHAYHVIRLLRTCEEVLTTGKVVVKRPDREFLLSIRRGAWTYDQLMEWAEAQEKKVEQLYKDCTILPHHPDREKLDQLCMELIQEHGEVK